MVGANPWLFVGGGLAFLGAVIIGDQWALRRAARPPPPVEGEGSSEAPADGPTDA